MKARASQIATLAGLFGREAGGETNCGGDGDWHCWIHRPKAAVRAPSGREDRAGRFLGDAVGAEVTRDVGKVQDFRGIADAGR